ncbi:hypothetical protein FRB95_010961 [Tulasnella sp. JGI-2019a]|nr:hypothetical protein FRB95_010961 [Tulasnella sp. JGI-2019a]
MSTSHPPEAADLSRATTWLENRGKVGLPDLETYISLDQIQLQTEIVHRQRRLEELQKRQPIGPPDQDGTQLDLASVTPPPKPYRIAVGVEPREILRRPPAIEGSHSVRTNSGRDIQDVLMYLSNYARLYEGLGKPPYAKLLNQLILETIVVIFDFSDFLKTIEPAIDRAWRDFETLTLSGATASMNSLDHKILVPFTNLRIILETLKEIGEQFELLHSTDQTTQSDPFSPEFGRNVSAMALGLGVAGTSTGGNTVWSSLMLTFGSLFFVGQKAFGAVREHRARTQAHSAILGDRATETAVRAKVLLNVLVEERDSYDKVWKNSLETQDVDGMRKYVYSLQEKIKDLRIVLSKWGVS